MFADTIQAPMEISDGNELGACSTAMAAGIGAGIADRANTPLYLDRYAEYQRLVTVMQEPWEALSRLN